MTALLPLCPPNPIPRISQADIDTVVPPFGSVTFNEFKAVPLPAPAAGEVELFTFKVPIGYDGIITGQGNGFINQGGGSFVEGSGDIVWRISANRATAERFLRDCGAITVSLGQINNLQMAQRLRIYSGDTVTVIVTCPNGSGALPPPGTGLVFAALHGWHYPR